MPITGLLVAKATNARMSLAVVPRTPTISSARSSGLAVAANPDFLAALMVGIAMIAHGAMAKMRMMVAIFVGVPMLRRMGAGTVETAHRSCCLRGWSNFPFVDLQGYSREYADEPNEPPGAQNGDGGGDEADEFVVTGDLCDVEKGGG